MKYRKVKKKGGRVVKEGSKNKRKMRVERQRISKESVTKFFGLVSPQTASHSIDISLFSHVQK